MMFLGPVTSTKSGSGSVEIITSLSTSIITGKSLAPSHYIQVLTAALVTSCVGGCGGGGGVTTVTAPPETSTTTSEVRESKF
jgi:hypothetical protein